MRIKFYNALSVFLFSLCFVSSVSAQIILYDQTGNIGGSSASSQNFEPAFDTFDSMAADDFVVPGGTRWNVEQVYVLGTYGVFPGPLNSVNVAFYRDNAGLPGTTVAQFNSLIPDSGINPEITVTLPAPVQLNQGTYWMSLQTNIDFTVGGQWYWTEFAVQNNSESAWMNPGDAYTTGCTSWSRRITDCAVGISPDLTFQILGQAAAVIPAPTMTEWGMITFMLLAGTGAFYFLKKHRKS